MGIISAAAVLPAGRHLVSRRTRPLTLLGPPGFRTACISPGGVLSRLHGHRGEFPLTLVEMPEQVPQTVGPVRCEPYLVEHYSARRLCAAYRMRQPHHRLLVRHDVVENLVRRRGRRPLHREAYFYARRSSTTGLRTLRQPPRRHRRPRVVLTHMSSDCWAGRRGRSRLREDGLVLEL